MFKFQTLFLVLSALLFGGCEKLSLLYNSEPITLSGVVQAGRVKNAHINLYKIEQGQRGRLLGATMTDSHGEFSISISPQRSALEIVATGGSYLDEATGKTVLMKEGDELSLVLDKATREKEIPVTPLTTQVREKFFQLLKSQRRNIKGIRKLSNQEILSSATEAIAELWGTHADVIMAVPNSPDMPGSSNSNEGKGAFLLAVFSQYLKDKNLSPDEGVSPFDVLRNINKDLSDGKLDGKADNDPLPSAYSDLADNWSTGMEEAVDNFKQSSQGEAFTDFTSPIGNGNDSGGQGSESKNDGSQTDSQDSNNDDTSSTDDSSQSNDDSSSNGDSGEDDTSSNGDSGDGGASDTNEEPQDITDPRPIWITSPGDNRGTRFVVRWLPVVGADHYKVSVTGDVNCSHPKAGPKTVTGTQTVFKLTDSDSGRHYICLSAFDGSGNKIADHGANPYGFQIWEETMQSHNNGDPATTDLLLNGPLVSLNGKLSGKVLVSGKFAISKYKLYVTPPTGSGLDSRWYNFNSPEISVQFSHPGIYVISPGSCSKGCGTFYTKVLWQYDPDFNLSAQPGNFQIARLDESTSSQLMTLHWTPSENALAYKVYVAKDSACKQIVDEKLVIGQKQVKAEMEGRRSGYLCVFAKGASGKLQLADNSPFAFGTDIKASWNPIEMPYNPDAGWDHWASRLKGYMHGFINGKWYHMGGHRYTFPANGAREIDVRASYSLNPETGIWNRLKQLPTTLVGAMSAYSFPHNGKLVLINKTVNSGVYNPTADSWVLFPSLQNVFGIQHYAFDSTDALKVNDRVYVMIRDNNKYHFAYLDLENRAWTPMGNQSAQGDGSNKRLFPVGDGVGFLIADTWKVYHPDSGWENQGATIAGYNVSKFRHSRFIHNEQYTLVYGYQSGQLPNNPSVVPDRAIVFNHNTSEWAVASVENTPDEIEFYDADIHGAGREFILIAKSGAIARYDAALDNWYPVSFKVRENWHRTQGVWNGKYLAVAFGSQKLDHPECYGCGGGTVCGSRIYRTVNTGFAFHPVSGEFFDVKGRIRSRQSAQAYPTPNGVLFMGGISMDYRCNQQLNDGGYLRLAE